MVGDPVPIFIVMILNLKSMSAGKAIVPGFDERSVFTVTDEIIARVIGQQHNTTVAIFRDAVTVLYGIPGAIEESPTAMRTVSEGTLPQYLRLAGQVAVWRLRFSQGTLRGIHGGDARCGNGNGGTTEQGTAREPMIHCVKAPGERACSQKTTLPLRAAGKSVAGDIFVPCT